MTALHMPHKIAQITRNTKRPSALRRWTQQSKRKQILTISLIAGSAVFAANAAILAVVMRTRMQRFARMKAHADPSMDEPDEVVFEEIEGVVAAR